MGKVSFLSFFLCWLSFFFLIFMLCAFYFLLTSHCLLSFCFVFPHPSVFFFIPFLPSIRCCDNVISNPVVPDGYGLLYSIGDDYIWWTITSLKRDMKVLKHYLVEAVSKVVVSWCGHGVVVMLLWCGHC